MTELGNMAPEPLSAEERHKPTTAQRYHRLQVLIVCGVAAFVVSLALTLAVAIHESHQRRVDSLEARFVLCTQINGLKLLAQTSLQAKIDETNAFLKQHPKGIPPFVTAHDLRRQVVRLRKERTNNAPADCEFFSRHPRNFRTIQ